MEATRVDQYNVRLTNGSLLRLPDGVESFSADGDQFIVRYVDPDGLVSTVGCSASNGGVIWTISTERGVAVTMDRAQLHVRFPSGEATFAQPIWRILQRGSRFATVSGIRSGKPELIAVDGAGTELWRGTHAYMAIGPVAGDDDKLRAWRFEFADIIDVRTGAIVSSKVDR